MKIILQSDISTGFEEIQILLTQKMAPTEENSYHHHHVLEKQGAKHSLTPDSSSKHLPTLDRTLQVEKTPEETWKPRDGQL